MQFSAQPENKLPSYQTFYTLFEVDLRKACEQLDAEERTCLISRFGQRYSRECVNYLLNEMIIAEFIELHENGLISLKNAVAPDCGWFVI